MKRTFDISLGKWWSWKSSQVNRYTGKPVQTFSLIPFLSNKIPYINISGTVERVDNQLSIHYEVSGDIHQIRLPEPSTSIRKHDLWKSTCFELFLAMKDRPPYWEFNMSSSGEWNVYVMDAYRQVNMREETAFTQLPFDFRKTNTEFSLDMSMDLKPILSYNQPLQIGITTIIQTLDENETYWALAHPGQKADFHLRESFIIEL